MQWNILFLAKNVERRLERLALKGTSILDGLCRSATDMFAKIAVNVVEKEPVREKARRRNNEDGNSKDRHSKKGLLCN